MKIARTEEVRMTLTVTLDESEYFEVTKLYTSKRVRVKEVRLFASALDGKFRLRQDCSVTLAGNRLTQRGETTREFVRLSFWEDIKAKTPKAILDRLSDETQKWAKAL